MSALGLMGAGVNLMGLYFGITHQMEEWKVFFMKIGGAIIATSDTYRHSK